VRRIPQALAPREAEPREDRIDQLSFHFCAEIYKHPYSIVKGGKVLIIAAAFSGAI
jgi:hypothetical protein